MTSRNAWGWTYPCVTYIMWHFLALNCICPNIAPLSQWVQLASHRHLAPVPMMIFRSHSKFAQNLSWSGLKCALLITSKFCTGHECNFDWHIISGIGAWSSMKWIGQYMRQLSVKGALVERQWVANHWYRVTKVMYEDHPQRDTRGHSLRRRTLAIHNNSLLWVPSKTLYDMTYAQDIVPMFCYVVCTTVISKMMKIHDNIPPIKGVNAVGVKHNWQQNSNFSTWLVVAADAAVASDPCVCMRQYGGYKICYAVSTHFFLRCWKISLV